MTTINELLSVNNNNKKGVLDLPPFSTPSVFNYVPRVSGPAHVQNSGLDHPTAIIVYAPCGSLSLTLSLTG